MKNDFNKSPVVHSRIHLYSGKDNLGWHCCLRQFTAFHCKCKVGENPTPLPHTTTYLHTSKINEENEANEITSTRWRNRLIWRILPVIWQYLQAWLASDSHFLPVIFNQRFLPKIKASVWRDHDQQNTGVAGLLTAFLFSPVGVWFKRIRLLDQWIISIRVFPSEDTLCT